MGDGWIQDTFGLVIEENEQADKEQAEMKKAMAAANEPLHTPRSNDSRSALTLG